MSKDTCKRCGYDWDAHGFAIPFPICPSNEKDAEWYRQNTKDLRTRIPKKVSVSEINRFLTKEMGKCWHEVRYIEQATPYDAPQYVCECGECSDYMEFLDKNPDFFTWKGFGTLFEWVSCQLWFDDLLYSYWACPEPRMVFPLHYIEPGRFAKALYTFLTGVYPSPYLRKKEAGKYDQD